MVLVVLCSGVKMRFIYLGCWSLTSPLSKQPDCIYVKFGVKGATHRIDFGCNTFPAHLLQSAGRHVTLRLQPPNERRRLGLLPIFKTEDIIVYIEKYLDTF